MLIKNTHPSGKVWVGALGRDVEAGEEVEVSSAVAGKEPGPFKPVESPTQRHLARVREDGGWEEYDPGNGLLAQVGNWERVTKPAAKSD